MSDVAEVYPTQRVVTCDVCGGSDSVLWFCKNCPGSLCYSCKAIHKTTAISSKHSVVPRTQTVVRTHGPTQIAGQCPLHDGKDIVIYCKECKVVCCVKCLAERHTRHDVCPIEEVYLEKENELNAFIKDLEDNVQKDLDMLMNEAKHDDKEHETSTKNAIDDVNGFRNEMKKEVDVQCDSLIDIIQKPRVDNAKFITEIQKQKQNVDKIIRSCKEKIWEGRLDLIEYRPVSPSSLVPNKTRSPIPKPKFLPDKSLIEAIRKEVGKIELEGEIINATKSDRAVTPRFYKINLLVQKVRTIPCQIGTSAVAIEGKNKAWVALYSNDTMYLHDGGDGKVIRSVTVQKEIGINDMVVKPSREIIVANSDKKVRRVSVDGIITTLIDTAPFFASGICLTESGQIVVCMGGQKGRDHVAIYSSDGKVKVSDMYGHNTANEQIITDPYRVVRNGTDYCIINYRRNVVTVDNSGSMKWVYDGQQAGMNTRMDPIGICCDKFKNILVSDYKNHCVHYLGREGQLIQVILTEKQVGLRYHFGIDVDNETGQVWVGNLNRALVLAKYLK